MTEPMIEAVGITKSFGKVSALDGVDVSVPRGCVLGLLGHNGAGKTTLVNILTTMIPMTSGTARVAGFDVGRDAENVRRRIGLTGQFASVDEDLSGYQNLVLIARLLGASRVQARQRATDLLEVFGIADAAVRKAKTYSGGMRRRLDLAACLVGRPDVVFLDEPTTGLDPTSRMAMWEIVRTLVDDGATMLLTTQYLDEADRLADIITVLAQGKIVASGAASKLKAEVGQLTVTVRLDAPGDVAAAEIALRGAGMTPTHDENRHLLIIPVASARSMTAVVRALDEARVEPAELSLTEPTLDDVYLALTEQTLISEPSVRSA
jgi:ABC-2 type transport system ATP-binding protein